jgi:uncharacterized membrane protein
MKAGMLAWLSVPPLICCSSWLARRGADPFEAGIQRTATLACTIALVASVTVLVRGLMQNKPRRVLSITIAAVMVPLATRVMAGMIGAGPYTHLHGSWLWPLYDLIAVSIIVLSVVRLLCLSLRTVYEKLYWR